VVGLLVRVWEAIQTIWTVWMVGVSALGELFDLASRLAALLGVFPFPIPRTSITTGAERTS